MLMAPLPEVGAVQSNVQLTEPELVCVALEPLIFTSEPGLDKVPLSTSREKPPTDAEVPPVNPIFTVYV